VGPRRIRDRLAVGLQPDHAPVAAEGLLERALLDTVQVILLELEPDPGPLLVAGVPGAHPVHVARPRGDPPRERQLERPLDRRLARLVRPTNDGEAGGERQVQVRVTPHVAQLQAGDPHRVSSAPDRRSLPTRRASRSSFAPPSSSAASSSAIWASRSRTNAPSTVSGEATGPSGSGETALSRTRSFRNSVASSASTSSTWTSSSSGRTPISSTSSIRSGLARSRSFLTRAGCEPTVAASSWTRSNLVLPTFRSST